MIVRDRVVLWVLATGFVAALLSWLFLGHWFALGLGVAAIGIACVVYRIEPTRIDLEHPERWSTRTEEAPRRTDQ